MARRTRWLVVAGVVVLAVGWWAGTRDPAPVLTEAADLTLRNFAAAH